MVLPSSGIISLTDLQLEYGGDSPIAINEYYRDQIGGKVFSAGSINANVPDSGSVSFSNFYDGIKTGFDLSLVVESTDADFIWLDAVLNTINVPDATNVPYTVTGVTSGSLTQGTLTGNFSILSSTDTLSFIFDKNVDSSSEFILSLDNNADQAIKFLLTWVKPIETKIQPGDIGADDTFATDVDISSNGNKVIIASYGDDDGALNSGAAYIFTYDGSSWSQQAKLKASDRAVDDFFGSAVAMSNDGTTVIVGASSEDPGVTNGGSAYIFTTGGTLWSQQAKLIASDVQFDDRFGESVDISGDGNTAIVGAPFEDNPGTASGAAYIFVRSGSSWSQQAALSGLSDQDRFGEDVCISEDGNTAAIGAWLADNGLGLARGSVYVYVRSGSSWGYQGQLLSNDLEPGDYLGYSIDISDDGNTIIAGTYGEDTAGSSAGAAYIFTRSGSTWSQQAKLVPSDGEASDQFGWSVSISGDGSVAIIGSRLEDDTASNAGSAYVFIKNGDTWLEQTKIQSSDAEASDFFGVAVAISGDGSVAIVGANLEDTGGTSAGAAYIFNN